MEVKIRRFAYTNMGVFGEMHLEGVRLVTVERPWLNNQPNISCIPTGNYYLSPGRYYRGGYDAMEVCDVPGRTHILCHKGNTMHDSAGCVLITSQEGFINGIWAGINSARAFKHFMNVLGGAHHQLTITGDIS